MRLLLAGLLLGAACRDPAAKVSKANPEPAWAVSALSAFFDTSVANDRLSVFQNYAVAQDSVVHYASLSLSHAATMTLEGGAALTTDSAVQVTGSSTIFAKAKSVGAISGGLGVAISAGSMSIESGSTISASAPTDLGSGGGSGWGDVGCTGANCGAAGGGAIRITVAGMLTLNGFITARGGAPDLKSCRLIAIDNSCH